MHHCGFASHNSWDESNPRNWAYFDADTNQVNMTEHTFWTNLERAAERMNSEACVPEIQSGQCVVGRTKVCGLVQPPTPQNGCTGISTQSNMSWWVYLTSWRSFIHFAITWDGNMTPLFGTLLWACVSTSSFCHCSIYRPGVSVQGSFQLKWLPRGLSLSYQSTCHSNSDIISLHNTLLTTILDGSTSIVHVFSLCRFAFSYDRLSSRWQSSVFTSLWCAKAHR